MGRLLDEIHSIPPATSRLGLCKISLYLRDLDPEMAADLQAGLDSELPAYEFSQVLSKFKIDVGVDLIRDHRSQRCVCYRKGRINE